MASRSGPLSPTPTSLDDLPLELHWNLTQYLGIDDLAQMRLLSSDWNDTAKTALRKCNPLTFNFDGVKKLVHFNKTFIGYEPTDDIAARHFCFQLPALEIAAAKKHLNTFVQKFGHLVTSLSVNLQKRRLIMSRNKYWYEDPIKRATVNAHVTLLLQGVKGQLQDLDLSGFAALESTVVGHGPFPKLRKLTVAENCTYSPVSSSFPATVAEAFILLLSQSSPALQQFEIQIIHCVDSDPLFLPNVLRSLVRVNPQIAVKLGMDLSSDGPRLLHELMTVAVRIVELDLVVHESLEATQTALEWIGAQSDWLRKLTFKVEFEEDDNQLWGLRLPKLRALEELNYVQKTVESLLKYKSSDYYPNLRKVTTSTTASLFTVTLPQVKDLTLYHSRFTQLLPWQQQGIYGAAAFRLPLFPNLESLTCSVKFIDLWSIVQFKSLRRLTFTPDPESSNRDSFWKQVTHGAWKLTLEQIRALPEPSEAEVRKRSQPCFSDLANLKEFKMAVDDNDGLMIKNLDALLWLSKTKRLQRLEKVELEESVGGDVKRFSLKKMFFCFLKTPAVPVVYLTELRKYHNLVFVS